MDMLVMEIATVGSEQLALSVTNAVMAFGGLEKPMKSNSHVEVSFSGMNYI